MGNNFIENSAICANGTIRILLREKSNIKNENTYLHTILQVWYTYEYKQCEY